MSTAEFHYLIGNFLAEREKALGLKIPCVLTAAYEAGVPIFTELPGRLVHRHERGRHGPARLGLPLRRERAT